MKLYSTILLGALLMTASMHEPKQVVKPHSFSYQGEFAPSFLSPCTISITTKDNGGLIKLLTYKYGNNSKTVSLADSANLSPADLDFFFTKLDSVPVLNMVTNKQLGLDGITVYNTVLKDGISNKFEFWSPRKTQNPQEHKVVEAVLGLARRTLTAQKEQEYFESLEQYFDFGLPCKITSTDPFEVRIYGSLSSNEEYELNKFVQALPSNNPILVDMTNFSRMGTMFYPLFRSLLARNTRIVWVTTSWGGKQLQEIGVLTDRIATTTKDGRALIQHLSSTTK